MLDNLRHMNDNFLLLQFVQVKKMEKPAGLMSIASKIAIQMNAKLGGIPWSVKNPVKVSED